MNTEENLTDVMNRRAHVMDGRAVDVSAVTGRARRMRRRRRVGAGALIAVLAVGTGLGVTALREDGTAGTIQPGVPTNKPTNKPSGQDPTLTAEGLPRGDAPGIAWIDDSGSTPVLYSGEPNQGVGGGRTLPDLGSPISSFTVRADGVVVLTYAGDVRAIDAQGNTLFEEKGVVGALASTPSAIGDVVTAWTVGVHGKRQVRVLPFGATIPRNWGAAADNLGPVVAVDDTYGTCTETTNGCAVTVQTGEGPMSVRADRTEPALAGDGERSPLPWVNDYFASAGDSPVVVTGENNDGCGEMYVVDPTAEMMGKQQDLLRGTNCVLGYTTISPNVDRAVVKSASLAEGDGLERIGMFDLNDDRVLWQRSAPTASDPILGTPRWEDDNHLLVPVRSGNSWTLVRYDASGKGTVASDPVPTGATAGFPLILVTDG